MVKAYASSAMTVVNLSEIMGHRVRSYRVLIEILVTTSAKVLACAAPKFGHDGRYVANRCWIEGTVGALYDLDQSTAR